MVLSSASPGSCWDVTPLNFSIQPTSCLHRVLLLKDSRPRVSSWYFDKDISVEQGASWEKRQRLIPQRILALGTRLRSRLPRACAPWVLAKRSCHQHVVGTRRWWNAWTVWLLSLKHLSFRGDTVQTLWAHLQGPPPGSVTAPSHVTAGLSPTEMFKTPKASNTLLSLDSQSAHSSPWSSFLPCSPASHAP